MSGIPKPRESSSRPSEVPRKGGKGMDHKGTAKKRWSPRAPWSCRVIPGQDLCLVRILGPVGLLLKL